MDKSGKVTREKTVDAGWGGWDYTDVQGIMDGGAGCVSAERVAGVAVKERAEPPRWVRRLVDARGVRLPEKTLYLWGVHLSRFLKYCRDGGTAASENLSSAMGQYLEAMREGGTAKPFQVEQARQALDVFRDGVGTGVGGRTVTARVRPFG